MSKYTKDQLKKFETLLEIMATLRSPTGCPWDKEQDHKSLRPYVLEEAYEVVDAIDNDDLDDLKEELGDLLLQIVFHSQLATEDSKFTIDDVISSITTKLVRRHPHVFGNVRADNPEDVLKNWNKIKLEEKGAKQEKSILEGVPESLPALLKAVTYSRRAAQVGFDWDRPTDVIEKLREEVRELAVSVDKSDQNEIEDELGDILFVMANLSRHLKVNPEIALENANKKFRRRFRYIEDRLADKGSSPQQSNLEEMDRLWNEAKEKLENK